MLTQSLSLASVAGFAESLEHLLGFFIVLVVLIVLWGVTEAFGKIFAPRSQAPAAVAKTPVTPAPAAAAVDDGAPTEEEVAAICACIAMLCDERHRIVSIRSANPYWGREGLREHFASHRIR